MAVARERLRRPLADTGPQPSPEFHDVSPEPPLDEQAKVRRAVEITKDGGREFLNPRQVEATNLLAGPQRHTGLVGGSRSGKTTTFMRAIVMRANLVKARHAVLRWRSNAVWPSIGMDTLPRVMDKFFPAIKLREQKSLHYFECPNGSQIWLGGLDDKERAERILGNEYATIFYNECSQIPYASVVIARSRLAQNVPGLRQRAYYDLNPTTTKHWSNLEFGLHVDPTTGNRLPDPHNYVRMFMNPRDNQKNLTTEYIASLDNMPERQRRRFRDGVYIDESDNQLWSITTLAQCKVGSDEVPQLSRIIVAVDPSGANNQFDTEHDPIGIIVAGLGSDGRCYVLADRTVLGSPRTWGSRAVSAYFTFQADAIIAEINYGGAMVESVIRAADPSVNYKTVTASRGKHIRAEPVAALYEQGLVRHVEKRDPSHLLGDNFAALEDELEGFTTEEYVGLRSPNRGDALVWAVSELMLKPNASGFVEFYRRQAAAKAAPVVTGVTVVLPTTSGPPKTLKEALTRGSVNDPAIVSPPASEVLLKAPTAYWRGVGNAPDGQSRIYTADEYGLIRVTVMEHLSSLERAGCVRYTAPQGTDL